MRKSIYRSSRFCYVGCLNWVFKSVQVLFNGMEAVAILTLIVSEVESPV